MSETANSKRQGRAITKALAALVAEARAAGCKNPKLFFEPESHTIFVLDGDHPGYINARELAQRARQAAIVLSAPLGTAGAPFDAGAW